VNVSKLGGGAGHDGADEGAGRRQGYGERKVEKDGECGLYVYLDRLQKARVKAEGEIQCDIAHVREIWRQGHELTVGLRKGQWQLPRGCAQQDQDSFVKRVALADILSRQEVC
jgi:hypothetical protein